MRPEGFPFSFPKILAIGFLIKQVTRDCLPVYCFKTMGVHISTFPYKKDKILRLKKRKVSRKPEFHRQLMLTS